MVGMQVTMAYEREQGRVPEDVSAENLGFDVRSTDPDSGQKRYIEVKARAKVGPVALTQNEWFKASRFGSEFYLYVVGAGGGALPGAGGRHHRQGRKGVMTMLFA